MLMLMMMMTAMENKSYIKTHFEWQNASPLHYPLISEWIVYNKSPSKKVVKLTHQQSQTQTQTYKYTMENQSEMRAKEAQAKQRKRKRNDGSSVQLSSVEYGFQHDQYKE